MTFRIDRLVSEETVIVFHLPGLLDVGCANTIKELIEKESTKRKDAVQCQSYGITQLGQLWHRIPPEVVLHLEYRCLLSVQSEPRRLNNRISTRVAQTLHLAPRRNVVQKVASVVEIVLTYR
jgi:hypothetical protein